MVESILFSVAESLIGKIASLAYEEAALALGVYGNLRALQDTLSIIKNVLLDAEQRQEQDFILREWLKQIKDVFSDAENVIDEFDCETLRKKVVKDCGSAGMKVGSYFSTSNPLVFRHRMARQIKELRERLDKIADDRLKFGLENNNYRDRLVTAGQRETHSYVSDSDVIGRDNDKRKIIDFLLQPSSGDNKDTRPSVMPIVGFGGLGKTTLAKLLFNDSQIEEHFTLRMWVTLSDGFDGTQIMLQMLQMIEKGNNLRMNQIESRRLRDTLASHRFLLILDDVWKVDNVKWTKFRSVLEAGGEGSKILVTTRDNSIASLMGTVPSYGLGGLSQEDCLSLLATWAGVENWTRYPNLREIGKEIVKKCNGVPLAVRTMGKLLYSKLDEDEWRFIRDNEIGNLPQNKDDILPAIKLSYDRLPSYLRQAFALLFLYPKGFQFDSHAVTELWMSLGLLQSQHERQDLEDLGRQYVLELNSKSFLHEFGNYFFKVQDLVQNLGIYVAYDFLMVTSRTKDIPERIRHLSLVEKDLAGATFCPKSTSVRTILFPVKGVGADSEAFLLRCVSKFKYLRVLDLSDSSYKSLPNSIGELKHLRYLNLSNNIELKKLPSSICKLQSLLILLLSGCKALETLPNGLRKFISLRHFSVTTKQFALLENDIASLNSLRVLTFEYCHNLESLLEGNQFSNLKELHIDSCGRLKSLLPYIKHLPGLQLLSVLKCEKLDMSEGHDVDPFPKLRLKFLHFEGLPQLVTLPQWLQGAADTLLSLFISGCGNLEVLPDWLPTSTRLTTLHIHRCPKLVSLPNDMHRLISLADLEIHSCPELFRRYQPQVGECWGEISHIQRISVRELREEI